MKRLILSAVAASMLAMPVMQASAAPLNMPAAPQSNLAQVDYQKHRPGDRHFYNHRKPEGKNHPDRFRRCNRVQPEDSSQANQDAAALDVLLGDRWRCFQGRSVR